MNPLIAPVFLSITVTVVCLVAVLIASRWRFRQTAVGIPVRSFPLAVLSALFVIAVRVALLPWWPIPQPAIYDEFSYLLLADTFAHGRLVNPPHPLWQHFEAPFILAQPVYASVYPAAQGLILALGIVVLGHPWWGVLLSCAALAAAAAWALHQWLPPRWAFLGSALFTAQFCVGSYWVNSYWGAALAATGGALVFGALGSLLRRDAPRLGAVFGLGAALLANSRPYEGLILVLVAVVAVRKRLSAPLIGYAAVILIPAALATGWYFHRVTGDWFRLPHQSYMAQYAASPPFVWQSLPPRPHYRHEPMKVLHQAFISEWARFRTIRGAVSFSMLKLQATGAFYGGAMFAVTLLCIPWLARGRARTAALLAAGVIAAVLMTVSFQVHYGAPAAVPFGYLNIQALRMLWSARRKGRIVAGVLAPSASVVMALAVPWFLWSNRGFLNDFPERAQVTRQLQSTVGMHLVFVRYEDYQRLGREWVYNSADIDGQRIVWARDMGQPANDRLTAYYRGTRSVWTLVPVAGGFRLAGPVPAGK